MRLCKKASLLASSVITVAAIAVGQTTATQAKEPPLAGSAPVKAIFQASAKRAEERLIPMVLRRVDTSGDAKARLEVQLDIEVLSRWIAGLKPGNDDHAAAIYLRINQLNAVATGLQEQFGVKAEPFNRIQENAARQLHQLTFDLPAVADTTKLDEICRNAAIYLLEIATGKVTNSSQVPTMRPSSLPPAPADPVGRANVRPANTGRSDPSRLIPTLTVSQPLRQQLLATLDMVERPAAYAMSEQDVAQLRPVLDDAINISAGLAGNAGVSAEERTNLERQLTESLALFSDRRLRDLGKQRISEMARYRQVLGSITRLNLSEANYKLLAPAFEYAQKTPAASKQVLSALERFVGYGSIYDKCPVAVTYAANPTLAKAIQKPYDASRKAFETSRSAFLSAVEGLGAGEISGSDPADLDNRLDEMRIALDLIDALQSMPQALDTYAQYKPKPGLEQRIAKEAAVAASPGKGPIRQEAVDVLKGLVRAADTARDLEKLKIEGPELTVFTAYTRKTPDEIYAKWRSNVTEIASQAAGGVPFDAPRIERNENLIPLVQSLSGIAAVEAQLQQAAALDRWADWGIDPKAVEQVVLPYRSAAAGAFAGFLADNTEAMRAWPVTQKERRPIMNFVLQSIGGAATLPELPSAINLNCAKLMTPLNSSVYGNQRYFSLAVAAMSSVDAQPAFVDQVRKMLTDRLGK